jgi:flagellar hook protein FlgE
MLRSMFSGVSGLRSHQTMMDVIGNNIANVNTTGYKAAAVVFQDLLSQVISGAGVGTDANNGPGGTNPAQVGLGVRIAGITNTFTQGASQLTGRSTDLSIQGDGFFVVRQGGQTLYTRAGSLNFDALGRLTTVDGSVLQGWSADPAGAINPNAAVGDLVMPLGQMTAPVMTATVHLGGNLPADDAVNTQIVSSITVYDKQGSPVDLSFTYEKTATDQWTVTSTMPDKSTGAAVTVGGPTTLTWRPGNTPPDFDVTSLTLTPTAATGEWGASPSITVELGGAADTEALRQYSGTATVTALSQDGSGLGALQSFSIGQDGVITGVFSNGTTRPVGRIALASFSNPTGLEKTGSSLYRATVNSGLVQVGVTGSGGRGTLSGSTLEMSNVDLAQEFTNLIIAQRGFQANSRVITASDELLQDLVNLKR